MPNEWGDVQISRARSFGASELRRLSCGCNDLMEELFAFTYYNRRFAEHERRDYAMSVTERCVTLDYEELLRGYYLGLNPRPDDEKRPVSEWEEWE